jgi:molybdopterin-containing oxidoreductase family iron-sulfur binding subunit
VFAQAVLGLYDPDRSQTITSRGNPSVSSQSDPAAQRPLGGACILTESVNSPTLAAQIRAVLQRFRRQNGISGTRSAARTSKRGARLAFGRAVETQYASIAPTSS